MKKVKAYMFTNPNRFERAHIGTDPAWIALTRKLRPDLVETRVVMLVAR